MVNQKHLFLQAEIIRGNGIYNNPCFIHKINLILYFGVFGQLTPFFHLGDTCFPSMKAYENHTIFITKTGKGLRNLDTIQVHSNKTHFLQKLSGNLIEHTKKTHQLFSCARFLNASRTNGPPLFKIKWWWSCIWFILQPGFSCRGKYGSLKNESIVYSTRFQKNIRQVSGFTGIWPVLIVEDILKKSFGYVLWNSCFLIFR